MSARLGVPGRGLADHRGPGGLDDPDQGVEVDLALAQVLVAVAARVGPVLGVVGVDQVDPAGDRLDPVDDAVQLLAAGVGVAGVEAEPEPGVADRSHSRARVSNRRAMAWLPPAVFSSSTGTSDSSWSERLAPAGERSSSSPPSVTCPPWTITAAAPTAAAPWQVSARACGRDVDAVVGRGKADPVGGVDVHDHAAAASSAASGRVAGPSSPWAPPRKTARNRPLWPPPAPSGRRPPGGSRSSSPRSFDLSTGSGQASPVVVLMSPCPPKTRGDRQMRKPPRYRRPGRRPGVRAGAARRPRRPSPAPPAPRRQGHPAGRHPVRGQ